LADGLRFYDKLGFIHWIGQSGISLVLFYRDNVPSYVGWVWTYSFNALRTRTIGGLAPTVLIYAFEGMNKLNRTIF
tara:strand:- start:58 stop:285 length:228 start_codon:yes stop_codon:yes gene_type:complete